MQILNDSMIHCRKRRPIKFVQFGEGNFLRAFVDWMIQELNDAGIYEGDVAVVQPQPFGRIKELQQQDGLYTLVQEGVVNGEFVSKSQIIDVLQTFVDPYTDYEKYLKLAEIETLEFVLSNTTEAGIILDETDCITNTPPISYPGKLLAFLKHRYETFNGAKDKGLYIIPCELIDNNGDELYRCLVQLAKINGLEDEFITWLTEANTFTNTLVDRIVPGYPVNRIPELTEKLGYVDNNLVMGEVFHLWVIENRNGIGDILAGQKAALNMVFTDDIKPYKIRKVRILNGLHTLMVPVAYLLGLDTVGETMSNDLMMAYIKQATNEEIIPATTNYLSLDELTRFSEEIYDRFRNPQIHHELMSISLNSTAKFKSRLLPTALDYVSKFGQFPETIAFSLASLLVFYKGKRGSDEINLQDEAQFLQFYQTNWADFDNERTEVTQIVTAFLGLTHHWEQDLNDIPRLTPLVTQYVEAILEKGMTDALTHFLFGKSSDDVTVVNG